MLYQSCWNNLVTGLIVPSSLLQFVNSLFQTCSNKFGTSSANTSCQQLVNRLVTTCLQVCSNLCVFTCVLVYTRKNAQVVAILQASCNKTAHKLSTVVLAPLVPCLLDQVWSKLLTTCNKLDDIIRVATRLFAQIRYSYDIIRMSQG